MELKDNLILITSKKLANIFENTRKINKITFAFMTKNLSEEWGCNEKTVKQYLDQTLIGGIHFRRIHQENDENNNFKGSHKDLTVIVLHVTRISQIIELLNPTPEDKKEIYRLLNSINSKYFK